MSNGVGPKKNTYNRNLSPAAARMVGGNYAPMGADEYNFKPSGSRFTIKDPLPPHKAGFIAKKGDAIHNRGARAVVAADAAIAQQNKMDAARSAGQITDRETVKQNKILNARRKMADKYVKTSNPKIMSTNPASPSAKASTLGGRSWMWNIGPKTR
jgi:hypothetical protein